MPPELTTWVQAISPPMLGILIYAGSKIMKSLHRIDRRLVRVETKLGVVDDVEE